PLVDQLLELRSSFRERRQWKDADAVRDALLQAHIVVEDTRLGTRWRLVDGQI
ncbi:MAG: cysteine--tRNA ligase, partial [Syntrophobacteraceae bacterium]|nr:cysteine--tRNA ligase [Syntrophobacteraceae bacterium]